MKLLLCYTTFMKKEWLEEQIAAGLSMRKMAKLSGKSPTTTRYWLRKHGLVIHRAGNFQDFSDEEFSEIVVSNTTILGILTDMGRAVSGSSYKAVHHRVAKLELDTSHWKGIRHGTSGVKQAVPWGLILVEDSEHRLNRRRIKKLISEGMIKNICGGCGLGPEWNGRPLTLQLDHKDGNRVNNLLSNIVLVCPNCHSQTNTFRGKSIKDKKMSR